MCQRIDIDKEKRYRSTQYCYYVYFSHRYLPLVVINRHYPKRVNQNWQLCRQQ